MPYYSQRLPWKWVPNALTQQATERRKRGEPIIDLTNSNPTQLFNNYPHVEIAEAFGAMENFGYEPDPLGDKSARAAVCKYYESVGIALSPDRLILTASTSEGYALLFKLFCDPNDQILAPSPSYPLFEFLAHLESVCVKSYQLQFDGAWHIDFDHLPRQITSRTRAIILVNPNNPTGSFIKQNEFDRLTEISLERGIPIISDEVFGDYVLDATPERVQSLIGHDRVLSFSLNGLSKAAGMPQMKLGWIAINGPEAEQVRARERLELIADTYLSVGTPVQKALPRLLEIGTGIRAAIAERTRLNLTTLKRLLENAPAQLLRCEGGWSTIIRLPATQPEESWTLSLLNECGILVQPGYFFDMPSEPYIVGSLISAPEEFEQGITGIRDLSMSA